MEGRPSPSGPPLGLSPARGGPGAHAPAPYRLRDGRVLKEPRLAEGRTVGIWEIPPPAPKRDSEQGGGEVLRKIWKKSSAEKGLQCVVSHSLPPTHRGTDHTHTPLPNRRREAVA